METRQQFTFDAVADQYDQYRPAYPEELFDELTSRAGLVRGDRILEVGCGTGQATKPLAARGFMILGLEPGTHLARIAREKLASFPNVDIRCETFEEWRIEREAFSLMISAQAFHWLSEETRLANAYQLLLSGGSLAVVGNSIDSDRSPLLKRLQEDYERHAPSLVGPPPMNWYTDAGPLAAMFEESPLFESAFTARYRWSHSYSSREYVGLLSTQSDHRILPASHRKSLHSSIARRIDESGGRIEIGYDANLYLARRAA